MNPHHQPLRLLKASGLCVQPWCLTITPLSSPGSFFSLTKSPKLENDLFSSPHIQLVAKPISSAPSQHSWAHSFPPPPPFCLGLSQELTSFFSKRPNIKHFRLCGPWDLCHNQSTSSQSSKVTLYIHKYMWLCFHELFMVAEI